MNAFERLRQGEPVFGLFLTYPAAQVAETAIWCGLDFVILDCEHGVVDESAQMEVLRTVCGSDAFVLVRTRAGDSSAVARYLDFGADGVLVPDVRTRAQAEEIAFAAHKRWTGGLRGDRYGIAPRAAKSPLVMVLIESPEGVANADAILELDGIDGAIVGTGDLSTQLGAPGDFSSPAFRDAVDVVERAARSRNKVLGSKPEKHLPIAAALARGHRLFLIGRDMGLLKAKLSETLTAAKKDAGCA